MYLEWSIKLSLLLYVTSSPGGAVRADGVTSQNGQFRFPLDSCAEGEYVTTGSVALFAHHGMPITSLESLRAYRSTDGSWLLATSPGGQAVDAFALSAPREEGGDIVFDQVALTPAGAELFGGYYAVGEVFDPITVHRSA
ncbi:HtaA domain-containing protein [Microbacterium sp. A196]|uniref:HtaA domain-containing protein n=1 Tax=Microbacterium sp. A196 TaxID=3457320 RepID=UPI003FD235C8